MANFTPSNFVTAQAKLIAAFKNSEMKFREPVVHKEFLRQAEIMVPSYKGLRTREDRTVTAYFSNRIVRALGSGRVFNHTGAKGDSTAFTPTWLTNSDKFAISLKQGDNNVFSLDEMLADEFMNTSINMIEGMEADAEAYIFANRSGVNVATQQGSFNGVQDVFEIAEATEGSRAMQITQTVMGTNKFKGGITIFCDSIAFDKFEKQRFQGAGNSENLTFQFGNAKMIHALGLDVLQAGLGTPYPKGFWIAVMDGTIAALPWIPKQNAMGTDVPGITTFGSMLNPIDGLNYATHHYSERSDQSGSNGSAQDVLTEWEVSVDLALDNAPLTTATETTLLAFGFL